MLNHRKNPKDAIRSLFSWALVLLGLRWWGVRLAAQPVMAKAAQCAEDPLWGAKTSASGSFASVVVCIQMVHIKGAKGRVPKARSEPKDERYCCPMAKTPLASRSLRGQAW